MSSTTSRLAVAGGSVRSPATYWVAGSRSSSVQPGGVGLDLAAQEHGGAARADELGEGGPAALVEVLDAAEGGDVVAVAVGETVAGRRGEVGLRAGEGVPDHVVEHVGVAHPRIRTDRQVTQPSSFSNSDTSTSVTV